MPNPNPAQPSEPVFASATPGEPMVTVKKADGTMIKVPLSQVRNMKTQKTQKQENTENKKTQPPSEIRPPQTLAEGLERLLAERKRIGQKRENETGNKKLETGDRDLKPETYNMEPVDQHKQAPGSRLQDPGSPWAADDHKSLLDDEFHKENLPMVIEARQKALAKVRPVSAFRATPGKPMAFPQKNTENKSAISNQLSAIGNPKIVASQPTADSPPADEAGRQLGAVRPMMHDVRPPAPLAERRSLGPVDELRSFSLMDLRHLDVTPQAAGSKLTQKFETLKDESYLLYMEGVKAWRESPLYRAYQDVLRRALAARQTVSQVLGSAKEREAMKLEEWGAVVKVNQSLV